MGENSSFRLISERIIAALFPFDAERMPYSILDLGLYSNFDIKATPEAVTCIIKYLDDLAKLKHSSILEMNTEDILKMYDEAKKLKPRIAIHFIKRIVVDYYSHEDVLNAIGKKENPPFPSGNYVLEGDLSLLEEVFNKGPIFRNI
jgi:hypothetical protein